jgi:hypothetical protein
MAGAAAPAAVVMAALEGAAVILIPVTEEAAPAGAAGVVATLIPETEEVAAAVVLRTIPETAAPAPVLIPGP